MGNGVSVDLNVLAAQRLAAGKYDRAHAVLCQLLKEQPNMATNESCLYATGNHAMRLYLQDNFEEALNVCCGLLGPMMAAFGATDIDVLNVMFCKALCERHLNQLDAAERTLKELLLLLHAIGAANNYSSAKHELVRVLVLAKRYEEAANVGEEDYTTCKRVFGQDAATTVRAYNILIKTLAVAADVLMLYAQPAEAQRYADRAATLQKLHVERV